MTEQPVVPADVEDVLASLEGLDDLAPDEHLAVFERAHESLRRTLADAQAHAQVQAEVQAEAAQD